MDFKDLKDFDDITAIVKIAEEIKKQPPEVRVIMLWSLIKDKDSALGRWAKIMINNGLPLENVVPCILSICEDMILSKED